MSVAIECRTDPRGHVAYFLIHDYDLDIFDGLPHNGPFQSLWEAEEAAQCITEAVTSANG